MRSMMPSLRNLVVRDGEDDRVVLAVDQLRDRMDAVLMFGLATETHGS